MIHERSFRIFPFLSPGQALLFRIQTTFFCLQQLSGIVSVSFTPLCVFWSWAFVTLFVYFCVERIQVVRLPYENVCLQSVRPCLYDKLHGFRWTRCRHIFDPPAWTSLGPRMRLLLELYYIKSWKHIFQHLEGWNAWKVADVVRPEKPDVAFL